MAEDINIRFKKLHGMYIFHILYHAFHFKYENLIIRDGLIRTFLTVYYFHRSMLLPLLSSLKDASIIMIYIIFNMSLPVLSSLLPPLLLSTLLLSRCAASTASASAVVMGRELHLGSGHRTRDQS